MPERECGVQNIKSKHFITIRVEYKVYCKENQSKLFNIDFKHVCYTYVLLYVCFYFFYKNLYIFHLGTIKVSKMIKSKRVYKNSF